MSDAPADLVDPIEEDIMPGLAVIWEPKPGGKVRISAQYDGKTIESGNYTTKIFSELSVRAQFLNSVEERWRTAGVSTPRRRAAS